MKNLSCDFNFIDTFVMKRKRKSDRSTAHRFDRAQSGGSDRSLFTYIFIHTFNDRIA